MSTAQRINELLEGIESPKELYAVSAYDSEAIRGKLSSMNVEANIPVNPKNGKKSKPYNAELYEDEVGFLEVPQWFKSFRRNLGMRDWQQYTKHS